MKDGRLGWVQCCMGRGRQAFCAHFAHWAGFWFVIGCIGLGRLRAVEAGRNSASRLDMY